MPVDPVRDAAIDVLLRVCDRGMHLDVALDKTLRKREMAERGRRFLTHLVYGTVRHRLLCDHALAAICTQPLEKLPSPILAILRMAIFQALFCNQVTRPAMVHTSVELAKRRGHAGLARLVNAVLRRAPSAVEDIALPDREIDLARHLAIRHSMPLWLARDWLDTFGPDGAEALCDASNQQAPVTLRANTLKNSAAALIERLEKSGIPAAKQTDIPEEVTITDTVRALKSKWFQQGCFMLQDAASMLPVHLLEPEAGDRVLDLCAAPGGKTTHIAQRTSCQAQVIAMDAVPARMTSIRENLVRMDLCNVFPVCGDGAKPPLVSGFDRVLVDAPCSGLGTIRRHPDLKWRVMPESIARLAQQQAALLRSGVDLCKNGGLIVYAVCTFTPQETREVLQTVCKDGRVVPEDGPGCFDKWQMDKGQYRILPAAGALDGFFLTRLRKQF